MQHVTMKSTSLGFLLLPCISAAFMQHRHSFVPNSSRATRERIVMMADISVTTPSPDAAAEIGIRDWPQQAKKGTWDETSAEGQTLVRYVLDGKGTLEIEDMTDSSKQTTNVAPGTLIEISGGANLSWTSDQEMIILTPGFEEGGTLLIVAAAVVILFGALIAGVGS